MARHANTQTRKRPMIILCIVFAVITVFATTAALLAKSPDNDKTAPPAAVQTGAESNADPQQGVENTDSGGSSSGEAETQPEETDEPVHFNYPEQMRAVQIVAGRDYLLSESDTGTEVLKGQIDKALESAQELSMNTIIIDTKYNDSVLFDSSALQTVDTEIDCVDYMVKKARELGLYVYATYDVTDIADETGRYSRAESVDGYVLDEIEANAGEFAEKYQVDGVLLNNYYHQTTPQAYAQYAKVGGGVGYQNYLKQVPEAFVSTAAQSIREHAPGTQVGLLADAVWENSANEPEGTETQAPFTAYGDGNADTKAFVQSGTFDLVMVQNFGSTNEQTARFGVVAEWWAEVAAESDVRLYMMHASDRVGTQSVGWTVYEQLTKQVIDLGKIDGISGSAFNSLKALLDNPGNSTTTLVKYMNNEINESWVLEQLSVSKPAELTYKTKEPTVTFQGASDPQAEVTINGEEITRNESGYFTVNKNLKEGLNTFVIEHKGKTLTYNITREIIVLKEVQPTGSIAVDGGMSVTVSALAYSGSKVTASVGGQSIVLSPSKTDDDSTEKDSGYIQYVGVFTAPAASESATSMGTISVTATSADGYSKTLQGAAVTVNKRPHMGEGVVVQVTAEQAETFPTTTLDDNSNAANFPLPKGTVDKTYGQEIVYKNGNKTYTYWNLESGVRVYSTDITTTGGSLPNQNQISSMQVNSSGAYTTITLKTQSKIPYLVSYDGNNITFKFQYTAQVPQSQTFTSSNALFKSANWSGSNLTLALKKSGGFLGYKAYYDNSGNLIIRFNNSPGSLSGARVVVDPGHGGNDPGALGFYPGKDEKDINYEIAQKLVAELQGRGATVLMLEPGSTMASRMASARAFNPQVLVSVHCNSAQNASAKGTEVYYFYSFQKNLAANASASISSALGTENRGAKQGLYYMTRESQFAAVLMEIGFVTNEAEYTKLINAKYQNYVASGAADAVAAYLGGVASGGGTDDPNAPPEESTSSANSSSGDDSNGDEVTGITLSDSALTLSKGETVTLTANVKPSGAGNKSVTWASEDTSVATVNHSGKVTAKGSGTTYIVAITEDGGYEAECKIKVGSSGSTNDDSDEEKLVQQITISGSATVKTGTRELYEADVQPGNATDKGVKWSLSDTSVAQLSKVYDSNGNLVENEIKVEGLKKGTVTLIATAYDDGRVTQKYQITIE